MNIAFICASPKHKNSASAALLQDLKPLLTQKTSIQEFTITKPSLTKEQIEELETYDTWVIAHPLYVDGIPSHLLSCLCQLEGELSPKQPISVYAIVNYGFIGGQQAKHALHILENWCIQAGLTWGMGIGLGGGGSLSAMENLPLGKGPKSQLGKAYLTFAQKILANETAENVHTSLALPRFLYKWFAEKHWRAQFKANGGKKKDLNKIPAFVTK